MNITITPENAAAVMSYAVAVQRMAAVVARGPERFGDEPGDYAQARAALAKARRPTRAHRADNLRNCPRGAGYEGEDMEKVTKRFARFWSPGSFTAETFTREGVEKDSVEWPDNAYAVSFHERDYVIDGAETYVGAERQIGPTYYHPDSKVETLEEVKLNPNATRILISNMECNRWERMIWSRWGNWPQPFDASKHAILARGNT